jgi:2-polyprenyl-3-methyl-5-hydroxy-6-metoxy-1,4-benzoquinol methylase
MMSILNDGFLCLMISIGHRTELFDIMASLPPMSSEQIANKAKLDERYVREWLACMVTGRIIDYDSHSGTYKLPPDHAASLTRAAGIANLGSSSQLVSFLGNVEDQVIECFREGGGVPYTAYPKLQTYMAESSARIHDAKLIDVILPLIPGCTERLKDGVDVLDVGCGSGHAVNLMARVFPKSSFVGYDMSREGIATGRLEAKHLRLSNVKFVIKDIARLNELRSYDLITAFDSIHDQTKPTKILKAISKALRTDGVFFMVENRSSSNLEENLDHPFAPMQYAASTMHCMTVSLAYDGEGLGNMWGEQMARKKLKGAGFNNIDVRQVEGDILHNYFIASKRGTV